MTAPEADPRHIFRQHVVESLYAYTFDGGKADKYDEQVTKTVSIIKENLTKIDSIIDTYAATFDHTKMARIDYAILQLGTYELFFAEHKTPYKVVINEAIELAKEFGSSGSPKLINGILGKAVEAQHNESNS